MVSREREWQWLIGTSDTYILNTGRVHIEQGLTIKSRSSGDTSRPLLAAFAAAASRSCGVPKSGTCACFTRLDSVS